MKRINEHPIIRIEPVETTSFTYNGREVIGRKGFTIASALHQAGFPIHSHSLTRRNRSLQCGIGKCGACEMLVDGEVKRICITLCDGVRVVRELTSDYIPNILDYPRFSPKKIYKTTVAIIGAGPAGLAARAKLNELAIPNIVIDSQDKTGGQFLMQTHRFFFFEEKNLFGGRRGFDIASDLVGESSEGIMLNCTVWDIMQDKRIAAKNIRTGEIFYVDCDQLIVATGAVPYFPAFANDDIPGVYTAAVVQKMMNRELTLLGKNILTVGAGNIGYLTSYQLMQAGANVKAIIEAMPREGGFPVQANRVRRLGIPILTAKTVVKAIPSADGKSVSGAVIADAKDLEPVPGTEKLIDGIDLVNICAGLVPDNQLLKKGQEVFGTKCYGAGDSLRISEGTSAVLRGTQVAHEIADSLNIRYDYNRYLVVSRAYFDSQQQPLKLLDNPIIPVEAGREKPFVLIDCLYGFACNPCTFACPQGAITKSSPRSTPVVDFKKCTGCMQCVAKCPGLAIFGLDLKRKRVFLAVEFKKKVGDTGFLVDNEGKKLGEGTIEKIRTEKDLTNLLRIDAATLKDEELFKVRGFTSKGDYHDEFHWGKDGPDTAAETYICHCEDVKLAEILEVIGPRKFVSVNEIKHVTRLGMGACRGKKCIIRLKRLLGLRGIQLMGEATPRAPLSSLVNLGEVYPAAEHDRITLNVKNVEKRRVNAFVAGGGIAGSALFRYLAEEGLRPVMINHGMGASWRNIAAGRPVFSLPELSEIARRNLDIFKDLQKLKNIDFTKIYYITFAHDEKTYNSLSASLDWQEGEMIETERFAREISPYFNPDNSKYLAALKTGNCWHATPGKTIDLIRQIGLDAGGAILEDCELIDLEKDGSLYTATVRDHTGEYMRYETELFINALGRSGNRFAEMLGIDTGLYAVRHQAFITKRLNMLGVNNTPLPMLIDRRIHNGFSAVYGQQLAETGQIIGCASPLNEHRETDKNLKVNSRDFVEIVAETFIDWLPVLSSVGFQALWSGYYIEPRMIIDPERGLFLGLKGQGFMLGQHLARLYVDTLQGGEVPDYFNRLKLNGDGLVEKAFK